MKRTVLGLVNIFRVALVVATVNGKADYKISQTRCDFESGDLCGWTQRYSNNDSYMWQHRSGSTPSRIVGTGPLFDHTLGPSHQGHYMYIEASTGRTNDTALLYSPVYNPWRSYNSCFNFWYHMFGATTGSLNVYMKPEEVQLGQLKPMFHKEGHQEDAWLLGFFQMKETDKPFQIVFEGVHGHGYTSDIAVDDVSLTSSTCSAQVTSESFRKGKDQAKQMDEAASQVSRPWLAGVVAAAVLIGVVLLASCVAAAVLVAVKRRRASADGSKYEASPDCAYVRYMSHQEALVQEDSDNSDGPGIM